MGLATILTKMVILRNKFYSEKVGSVENIVNALRTTAKSNEIMDSDKWLGNNEKDLFKETCWDLTENKNADCPEINDCHFLGKPIAINQLGEDTPQYFATICLGKNSSGDFIKDDLTEFKGICEKLKTKYYASWVSMTDAWRDICDDISYWGVTFTF